MVNKKTTTIKIAGTLTDFRGKQFCLLHPRPVSKDSWMSDNMNMFFVCGIAGGRARHIIIHGDFTIDYACAGKEMEIITYNPEDFIK